MPDFTQLWLTMVLALVLDRFLGEPPARLHPVVWMGRYLNSAGNCLQKHFKPQKENNIQAFWLGALLWCAGAAISVAAAYLLQWLIQGLLSPVKARTHWAVGNFLMALLMAVLLKPLLSWRMLTDEVAAVGQKLGQSLQAGRQQLAHIVSRDVTQLDRQQVRESAIESLAENLNDSVIATLFWFALLGLPGAVLHRYADTADSMWGYREQHWEWVGKWAALVDDVLAYLPARLSAAALLAAAWLNGQNAYQLAQQLPQQARLTPSPNSGWPMAAMALALNVRLSKPHVYTLHATGNTAQIAHIPQSIALVNRAVLITIAIITCMRIGGFLATIM